MQYGNGALVLKSVAGEEDELTYEYTYGAVSNDDYTVINSSTIGHVLTMNVTPGDTITVYLGETFAGSQISMFELNGDTSLRCTTAIVVGDDGAAEITWTNFGNKAVYSNVTSDFSFVVPDDCNKLRFMTRKGTFLSLIHISEPTRP